MKNKRITLIGLIFLVVITSITTLLLSGISNVWLMGKVSGYTADEMKFINKLMASKELLSENFYGEITDEMIYDGAMSGMFEALDDPYTSYLDNKKNQEMMEITEGKYEGIGVVISTSLVEKTDVTIVGIVKDSPAEKAELMLNDKIVKINGEDCSDLTLNEVAEKMKVKAGTNLSLIHI